jgi:copper chaperone CopZ
MATLLMACTAQNHGEERQIIFHVEGMFCESCVGAVTNEIERMNGTSNVNVTLEDSTVVFTIPANRVPDRETIRESIERLGYTVHFDLGSNQ